MQRRRNNSDDIPLALRASPKRLVPLKGVRYAFAIFIVTCLAVVFIGTYFLSNFNSQVFFQGNKQVPSADGRLLGHFPYPEASSEDLIAVYPDLEIHKDTYAALKLMRKAALNDGINLILLSGYRSHKLQKQIFFQVKSHRNQTAIERARVSAPPGYSEHSTGYAIDLGDSIRRDTDLSVEFEQTNAFRWLKSNAAKYHFVLSFPEGNEQGVSYEPWHWRFEGTADALRQFEAARRRFDGS